MFAELAVTGLFYLRFADIRDSDKAYSILRTNRGKWDIQYILPNEFMVKFNPKGCHFSPVSKYEGQVLVKAEFAGLPHFFDTVAVGHRVKEALEKYGCVIAFEMGVIKESVSAYRAEYSNINATNNAVLRLNGSSLAVIFPPRNRVLADS